MKATASKNSIKSIEEGEETAEGELYPYTPTSSILPMLNQMTHLGEDEFIEQLRSRVFQLEAENERLKLQLESALEQNTDKTPNGQICETTAQTPSLETPFDASNNNRLQLESMDSMVQTDDASDIIMALDSNLNLVQVSNEAYKNEGDSILDSFKIDEAMKLRQRNEQLEDKLKVFEENLIRLQDSVTELDVQRVAAESCLQVALKQLDEHKSGWGLLNSRNRTKSIFDMSKEWNQLLQAKLALLEGDADRGDGPILTQDKLLLENKLLQHELAQIKIELAQLKGEMDQYKKENMQIGREKKTLSERMSTLQKVLDLRMGQRRPLPSDYSYNADDQEEE